MNKINFIFAVHNHQPVGNFEHVVERCFTDCYQPFLDMLSEFPSVRLGLHFSGPLLQFIERKHPYYIERLRTLAARNQVEMLGGGFYEPILTAIPPNDAVGQIKMMSDWLQQRLGQRPTGLWLPERVWEPHLPSLLAQAGVRYTIVDDTHLRAAGIGADQIVGHYITEDNGHSLAIFPVDRKLRYLIPFRLPEETIEYLRWMAGREPDTTVTLGDDGEKFGVWPDTHKWVFEEGYLRRLFGLLDQNRDWIRMITPSEHLKQSAPRGRVYLPSASYAEMMEWALPTPARQDYEDFHKEIEKWQDFARFEPFIRGGSWRNFLVKYPEVNFIHKKMLRVSALIEKSRRDKKLDAKTIDRAQDELWQGQCNCAYWHGLFGGLYLSHLRHALFEHLIAAEALLRGDVKEPQIERLDYDKDGREEILVTTPQLTAGVSPSYGGSMFELDFLPKHFNLMDTLTRRREAYHRAIPVNATLSTTMDGKQPMSIHSVQRAKESGLQQHVIDDWYWRRMFQDHLFGPTVTLPPYSRCDYHEMGDFMNQPFEILDAKIVKGAARIVLRREGGIYEGNVKMPLTLLKTYLINADGSVTVEYHLSSPANQEMAVWFGSEINFSLLGNALPDFYYDVDGKQEGLASFLDLPAVDAAAIVSKPAGLRCELTFAPTAHLWTFPVETVSQSEGGLERTYQGSSLTPHWHLKLKPDEGATVRVKLTPRGN